VKQVVQLGAILMMTPILAASICMAQASASSSSERDTAFALEQQGKFPEAERAWRTVVTSHPADAEGYAHLGLLEARQEHYKEAIPLYRKALSLNPSMPDLRLNFGLALFKGGELRQAIETFTPLLKSEPLSSMDAQRVTALIGIAHYGLGEFSAAIPFLKQATQSDSGNLPFRLLLAQSCLSTQQYQCVLDVYHEILTLNAESAEADMLAGEALDEMRDHDGAIQQFRAAVKADPKVPNVHFGLGYLLWSKGQFEEAAQEFQAELVNVPNHAEALTYLADCDQQMSHPEAALPLLEKAIQINPNLAQAHLDLGIVYADSERRDDALRELKTAVKLSPNDPAIHYRLARLYMAMGKKTEANAEFQTTSNLHKAANDTVFNKLKQAQQKGRAVESPTTPAADK